MRDLCILGDDFHCQILVVEHAPNALEGSFDESLHLLGVLLCVRAPGRKPVLHKRDIHLSQLLRARERKFTSSVMRCSQ